MSYNRFVSVHPRLVSLKMCSITHASAARRRPAVRTSSHGPLSATAERHGVAGATYNQRGEHKICHAGFHAGIEPRSTFGH
jgi:hypothetical protein